MKILITGGNGQLAKQLVSIINSGECELGEISKEVREAFVVSLGKEDLDISNLNLVRECLYREKPDVLINCAAFTNVDACEEENDLAFRINSLGPRNLAIACEEVGSKILQVSTDYVFSGVKSLPLREYDETKPYSVYGKTKLMGEDFIKSFSSKYFIVRTSWLYGYYGKNFVYTMLKLAKERKEIKVVNDQIGNPTNAEDLAYHILKLIETDEYGIFHCTGNGECSWYDFASKIIEYAKLDCKVKPCTSLEYKRAAKRPEFSSLDNMMLRCTVGDYMRDWEKALKVFIDKVI